MNNRRSLSPIGWPLGAAVALVRTAIRLIPAVRKIDADKEVQVPRDDLAALVQLTTLHTKREVALKGLEAQCPPLGLAELISTLDPVDPALLQGSADSIS